MISLPLLAHVAEIAADAINSGREDEADWPDSGRRCGECQACCEVLNVADLPEKVRWQRCKHQCAAGCGIYENRPKLCRKFQCMWRSGLLEESDVSYRPDMLGLALCMDGLDLPDVGVTPIVHAHECWPGAHREIRANIFLGMLSRRWLVALHLFGTANEVKLGGPAAAVEAFIKQRDCTVVEDRRRP